MAVVVVWCAASVVAVHTAPQMPVDGQAERAEEAWRTGGLREAARIAATYVMTETDLSDVTVAADVRSLFVGSNLVAVGQIIDKTPYLTAGARSIRTEWTVSILETIKGDVEPGGIVTVSANGGLVSFGDGTSAEVKIDGRNEPPLGERYVFFLQAADEDALSSLPQERRTELRAQGRTVSVLTQGSEGLFQVPLSGKVRAAGRPTDLVAIQHSGEDAAEFLSQLRALAAER